jgi:hypothetical protein
MKTSTVIALAILGIAGVVAYKLYLKNQSQTNTTGFSIGGLSGTIATSTLASGVANLLGDLIGGIGGVFSGSGSNSSGGGGTYSSPDYSQWNAAYDPNAAANQLSGGD